MQIVRPNLSNVATTPDKSNNTCERSVSRSVFIIHVCYYSTHTTHRLKVKSFKSKYGIHIHTLILMHIINVYTYTYLNTQDECTNQNKCKE